MMQCRSSSDIYDDCLRHDVTGETTIIVSRNDGDWMTLVVWQDRDDVLSYQVSIATESTKKSSCTGQCYYFAFTGTSICVNFVQVLLVLYCKRNYMLLACLVSDQDTNLAPILGSVIPILILTNIGSVVAIYFFNRKRHHV